MGRRDIQFYDLYKRGKPDDAIEKLENGGYVKEGILEGDFKDEATGAVTTIREEDEPIYGDIEADDFNRLFHDRNYTDRKYGKSITVTLESRTDGTVTRDVKEDFTGMAVPGGVDDLSVADPHEMTVYS